MQNKESMSHVNMKYDLLFFILIINVIRNKYSSSNKLKINDKRQLFECFCPQYLQGSYEQPIFISSVQYPNISSMKLVCNFIPWNVLPEK